jgi:hypothetical protein
VVRGTKHNSFDDTPLLNPDERAQAPSDPIRAHSVIAATVVAFFNRSFGYPIPTALNPDLKRDLLPIDLKQIAEGNSTPRN